MFCKKGVLRNFTKYTRKRLCWSLFLIKLQTLGLIKREALVKKRLWVEKRLFIKKVKQKQNLEFAVEKKAGKEQSWKKKHERNVFLCIGKLEASSINNILLASFYFYSSPCYSFKLSVLFIIMIPWSCFKAEAVIGRYSSKIVVLQCSFCALIKALRNACEKFNFSNLFISSSSLQSYWRMNSLSDKFCKGIWSQAYNHSRVFETNSGFHVK